MRLGVIAALLAIATPAVANPADRIEATGFVGVEDFSKDNGLGNALVVEQRPQSGPTFGARLTYIALQTGGDLHLDLGVEAELSFTPTWTAYGFETMYPSYFAPVLGYRANLMLRLGGGFFQPHVLGGVGGATVISDSPFMAKETDPVFVWGLGAQLDMGNGWQVRLDGRQLLMESISADTTASYEALLSVGIRFGQRPAKTQPEEQLVVENPPPPPPGVDPNRDTDGDGIADKLDQCPQQMETVNGVDDADGCPEQDPDGDRLVTGVDKCPDRAEDFDKFEDEDGCPEDDNDKDGIADARDKCPNEAEVMNGIDDDDGCVDQVPPALIAALATATQAKFDPNSVRISSRIKTALDKALLAMLGNAKLKYVITVHPEKDGEKDATLAKRRADNLKGYLIEQGVAMGSLTTAVGSVVADKKAPLVEVTVAP